MNGIEKITARIIADAEAEAAAIRSEAEAKCEQVRSEYDKNAQDVYQRIIKNGAGDCEAHIERAGRTAEMEAKKSVLKLKQDMVSAAFNKAVEQVQNMPEDKYIAFLAGLAAKAACSGCEELIVSSRDAAIGSRVAEEANKILENGKLLYNGQTREMLGGILLRDGDVEINCSLETIIAQYRYELASQVAEIMFD